VRLAAFERFIGVDWSGAEGQFHKGIQVAEFLPRTRTLRLVRPPTGLNWSREGVLDFITSQSDRRTLVGMDFCFSLPWNSDESDLPACLGELRGVRELWAFVDEFCKLEPFFFAGPIWSLKASPFRPFIRCWSHTNGHEEGVSFKGGQFRKTEIAGRKLRVRPISVYKMVGPQVGAGSFAGMRFLHSLTCSARKHLAVWPFDQIGQATVVVCEVYPSIFYRLANSSRPTESKVQTGAHGARVADVLGFFDARYTLQGHETIDAIDALVIAAALQSIVKRGDGFIGPNDPIVTTKEGWILGAPFGDES
jgi:hypothetical protein